MIMMREVNKLWMKKLKIGYLAIAFIITILLGLIIAFGILKFCTYLGRSKLENSPHYGNENYYMIDATVLSGRNSILYEGSIKKSDYQRWVDGDTKHEKKHTEIFISNQLDNKKCSTKVIEGNGITIKCVNKSELTSKKYGIVTYKTLSWPVRGYLRHLKSGKVVYVKECVRVRKALKDKATLKDQQYQKIIIK